MVLGRRKRPEVVEPKGPARVLVVSEGDGSSELLRRILTGPGHEVATAADHDSALVALKDQKPRCVVLDLSAGGIGQNLKLLDAIRNHIDDDVAAARVVLVAQRAANRMFSWQAGIDGYLIRPFHANDLLREVDAVLARPDEERVAHRATEMQAAQAEGRTFAAAPMETLDF